MREILFRGKRIDNSEWIEGFYAHFVDLYKKRDTHRIYIFLAESDCGEFYPDYFEIDPETVGQYTGLTDKNGKRIFEGDIIKATYIGPCKGLSGIAPVIYQDCKFSLVWGNRKEPVCLTHFCNVEFEVIGNIHDNPELLKGAD